MSPVWKMKYDGACRIRTAHDDERERREPDRARAGAAGAASRSAGGAPRGRRRTARRTVSTATTTTREPERGRTRSSGPRAGATIATNISTTSPITADSNARPVHSGRVPRMLSAIGRPTRTRTPKTTSAETAPPIDSESCRPLAELAAEDRDERHHLAGVAAEVVREREAAVGRCRSCAPRGASPRSCSQASNIMRRPDAPTGWPKLFRPPSGLTGRSPLRSKVPSSTSFHAVPRSANCEVFVDEELGGREAVVHLGHRDLLARVGDAGLRVRVAAGRRDLGEGRVVVRRDRRCRSSCRRRATAP